MLGVVLSLFIGNVESRWNGEGSLSSSTIHTTTPENQSHHPEMKLSGSTYTSTSTAPSKPATTTSHHSHLHPFFKTVHATPVGFSCNQLLFQATSVTHWVTLLTRQCGKPSGKKRTLLRYTNLYIWYLRLVKNKYVEYGQSRPTTLLPTHRILCKGLLLCQTIYPTQPTMDWQAQKPSHRKA